MEKGDTPGNPHYLWGQVEVKIHIEDESNISVGTVIILPE